MFSNSHYGNKGYIFTLDGAMALFIVMIVLISSFLLITKSNEDSYSLLQQIKTSNDLFTSLNTDNKLSSLNTATINSYVENVIKGNALNYYNYSFKLECETKISQKGILPNEPVLSSEIVVVSDNMELCVMRYWIWPK